MTQVYFGERHHVAHRSQTNVGFTQGREKYSSHSIIKDAALHIEIGRTLLQSAITSRVQTQRCIELLTGTDHQITGRNTLGNHFNYTTIGRFASYSQTDSKHDILRSLFFSGMTLDTNRDHVSRQGDRRTPSLQNCWLCGRDKGN